MFSFYFNTIWETDVVHNVDRQPLKRLVMEERRILSFFGVESAVTYCLPRFCNFRSFGPGGFESEPGSLCSVLKKELISPRKTNWLGQIDLATCQKCGAVSSVLCYLQWTNITFKRGNE